MRMMQDALDLSAIKHISLVEASKVLLGAMEGNSRGLSLLLFRRGAGEIGRAHV